MAQPPYRPPGLAGNHGRIPKELSFPKFKLIEEEASYLVMQEILPWFETIIAPVGPSFMAADPADDKFIWCALAGNAECVVSGDKHLLSCPACPVPVRTPAVFLARINNRRGRNPREISAGGKSL